MCCLCLLITWASRESACSLDRSLYVPSLLEASAMFLWVCSAQPQFRSYLRICVGLFTKLGIPFSSSLLINLTFTLWLPETTLVIHLAKIYSSFRDLAFSILVYIWTTGSRAMRQHREKCCGFPSPAHSTTGDPFPGFSIEREGFSLGSYAPVALKKKYISITGPGLESVLG